LFRPDRSAGGREKVTTGSQTVTVNSRKFDGSIRRSWHGELANFDEPLIELIGSFDRDVDHPDLGRIQTGTVSHEFFWTNRWYNVFRFHEPSGELRNYYVNLAMPPTFTNNVIDYVDLDIDILIWPDGGFEVLDVEDFEANSVLFDYPTGLKLKVETELDSLITRIKRNELSGLYT
jgi:protein associated with RNAse G/E